MSLCTGASVVARISEKGVGGVNKKPYINKTHIIILYYYYCVQSCPSTYDVKLKAVFFFIDIFGKNTIDWGGEYPLPPTPFNAGYATDRSAFFLFFT